MGAPLPRHRQLRHRHDRVRRDGPAAQHRGRPAAAQWAASPGTRSPRPAGSSPSTRSASSSARRHRRLGREVPPAPRDDRAGPRAHRVQRADVRRCRRSSWSPHHACWRGCRTAPTSESARSSRPTCWVRAIAPRAWRSSSPDSRVANVVGVPLGTYLGQQVGWRAAFMVVTAIFALATVFIAFFVPRASGRSGADAPRRAQASSASGRSGSRSASAPSASADSSPCTATSRRWSPRSPGRPSGSCRSCSC